MRVAGRDDNDCLNVRVLQALPPISVRLDVIALFGLPPPLGHGLGHGYKSNTRDTCSKVRRVPAAQSTEAEYGHPDVCSHPPPR